MATLSTDEWFEEAKAYLERIEKKRQEKENEQANQIVILQRLASLSFSFLQHKILVPSSKTFIFSQEFNDFPLEFQLRFLASLDKSDREEKLSELAKQFFWSSDSEGFQ